MIHNGDSAQGVLGFSVPLSKKTADRLRLKAGFAGVNIPYEACPCL
ncbi:hypothetical protein X474_08845 [Dethiosulfatarculus sandiegensis]|uniref:Uncharacterized protein n=1 Tax=Dethiosulfatarculus sandiegensis TaxID=1429043 RepID=A0A0D2GHG3_9BACT|nr:hypothetical protein X474_08845 [Dethiosulfatarculus sandiegensis]